MHLRKNNMKQNTFILLTKNIDKKWNFLILFENNTHFYSDLLPVFCYNEG